MYYVLSLGRKELVKERTPKLSLSGSRYVSADGSLRGWGYEGYVGWEFYSGVQK
jgi:hypothetical protein